MRGRLKQFFSSPVQARFRKYCFLSMIHGLFRASRSHNPPSFAIRGAPPPLLAHAGRLKQFFSSPVQARFRKYCFRLMNHIFRRFRSDVKRCTPLLIRRSYTSPAAVLFSLTALASVIYYKPALIRIRAPSSPPPFCRRRWTDFRSLRGSRRSSAFRGGNPPAQYHNPARTCCPGSRS